MKLANVFANLEEGSDFEFFRSYPTAMAPVQLLWVAKCVPGPNPPAVHEAACRVCNHLTDRPRCMPETYCDHT